LIGLKLNGAASANALLETVSRSDWASLGEHFERIAVTQRQDIVRAEEPYQYLWFPESGVYSHLIGTKDGTGVDVSITGSEGVIGIPGLFGIERPITRTVAQFDGAALRIPIDRFLETVGRDHALFRAIERYSGAMLLVVAQLSACNRLHSAEQRLCRWLLSVRDRLHRNDIRITHEFLALMLGTRRPSVTEVANKMQKRGLIRYERGFITIFDVEQLRDCACECYDVVRRLLRSV
jgi:CRP-like cAMP-binding protein